MSGNFFKYIIIGILNTIFTLAFIFLLTYLGNNIYYANTIGYIFGIILSFFLNSKYTFQSKISFSKLLKFIIVCIISFLINLFCINYILKNISSNIYLAQFIGCIFYTITGYLLNKNWALK